MSNEARYFSVLSAAIAKIESDSFEARGGIYDRLWKLILKQLETASDASDERIAAERTAFIAAVQRIELGERAPAAYDEPPRAGPSVETPRAEPPSAEPASVVPPSAELPSAEPPSAEPPSAEPPSDDWPHAYKPARQRRVHGRILVRMVGGFLLLLLVGLGVLIARPDLVSRHADNSELASYVTRAVTALTRMTTPAPSARQGVPQRAVLYEENATTATGSTFTGRAFWKELRAADVAPSVSIEVEIPDKGLFLEISVSKSSDPKSVISHVIEFKFLTAERKLSDAVQNVLGILMKSDELSAGAELAGKVVPVSPGVFLMGLSGAGADLARNSNLLKERAWMDIAIVSRNGVRGLLAIEKGTAGQNAINGLLGPNASG
jgi:hypothetical protein